MPYPYVVEGPSVIVPARVAAVLSRAFDLDGFRINERGRDQQVDEVMMALHIAALGFTKRTRSTGGGTEAGTGVEPGASSDLREWLVATEVAVSAGCTSRAVRRAAAEGRLVGEVVDGCWRFDRTGAAIWAEAQQRKRGE